MKKTIRHCLEQIKIVVFIYIIICVVQRFSMETSVHELLRATLVSFTLVVLSIILKNFIKKPNLPGFAWATIIAFLFTIPISPLSSLIVSAVKTFNFSITGLPLLAFAGISVGDQLAVLKELSWKIVLVSFIVMSSTYFGSALISQTILKFSGML